MKNQFKVTVHGKYDTTEIHGEFMVDSKAASKCVVVAMLNQEKYLKASNLHKTAAK